MNLVSESNPAGGGLLTCLIVVLAVAIAMALAALRK